MISFASYAKNFQSAKIAHVISKSAHPVAIAGSEGLITLTYHTLESVEYALTRYEAVLRAAIGKNKFQQIYHASIAFSFNYLNLILIIDLIFNGILINLILHGRLTDLNKELEPCDNRDRVEGPKPDPR